MISYWQYNYYVPTSIVVDDKFWCYAQRAFDGFEQTNLSKKCAVIAHHNHLLDAKTDGLAFLYSCSDDREHCACVQIVARSAASIE